MTIVLIFITISALLLIGPAIKKRIESRAGLPAIAADIKPEKTIKAKRAPKSGRKT